MATKAMSVREKFSVEFVSTQSLSSKGSDDLSGLLPDVLFFDTADHASSMSEPVMTAFADEVDPVTELRNLFSAVGY